MAKRERPFMPQSTDLVMPLIPAVGRTQPLRVTLASPLVCRRAVYRIACFFRREFRYDSVQYGYEGREDDSDHNAFLWLHPEASFFNKDFLVPAVGACCFRLRPDRQALQWVWIHPYWRCRGLLSKQWKQFGEEFGEFWIEGPVSKAMQAFLAKQGVAPPPEQYRKRADWLNSPDPEAWQHAVETLEAQP